MVNVTDLDLQASLCQPRAASGPVEPTKRVPQARVPWCDRDGLAENGERLRRSIQGGQRGPEVRQGLGVDRVDLDRALKLFDGFFEPSFPDQGNTQIVPQ